GKGLLLRLRGGVGRDHSVAVSPSPRGRAVADRTGWVRDRRSARLELCHAGICSSSRQRRRRATEPWWNRRPRSAHPRRTGHLVAVPGPRCRPGEQLSVHASVFGDRYGSQPVREHPDGTWSGRLRVLRRVFIPGASPWSEGVAHGTRAFAPETGARLAGDLWWLSRRRILRRFHVAEHSQLGAGIVRGVLRAVDRAGLSRQRFRHRAEISNRGRNLC